MYQFLSRKISFGLCALAILPFLYGSNVFSAMMAPPSVPVSAIVVATVTASYESQAISLQSQLWSWAWGVQYVDGTMVILMEPAGGNDWNLNAVEDNGVSLNSVGTGLFTVSNWKELTLETSIDIEPSAGHTIKTELATSAVAGTFQRPSGATTILVVFVTRMSSLDLTEPARSFDTYSMGVGKFAASLSDASSLVNELFAAMSTEQPGDPGPSPRQKSSANNLLGEPEVQALGIAGGGEVASFGSGGGGSCGISGPDFPCFLGGELSCECLCEGALGADNQACMADFGACIWVCVGGAIAVLVTCNLACAATGFGAPACVTLCVFLLRGGIATCAAACLLRYEGCKATACGDFLQCRAGC